MASGAQNRKKRNANDFISWKWLNCYWPLVGGVQSRFGSHLVAPNGEFFDTAATTNGEVTRNAACRSEHERRIIKIYFIAFLSLPT